MYELSLTFNKYHVIESPFKVLITDLGESVRHYESQVAASSISTKNQTSITDPATAAASHLRNHLQSDSILHDTDESINATHGSAIGSVCLMSQREFPDMPSLDYELSDWNNQLNNSLNKILLVENSNIGNSNTSNITINNGKPTKRALTPITDTSEEESQETSN